MQINSQKYDIFAYFFKGIFVLHKNMQKNQSNMRFMQIRVKYAKKYALHISDSTANNLIKSSRSVID